MSTKKTTIQYKPESERNFEGEVTEVQILAWKKEFSDRIYQLTRDGKAGYMRKPDRLIMDFLTTVPADKFMDTLFENCWLGGAADMLKDEDVYLWLRGEAKKLLDWGTGELKKI